jgi:hypothetical protein
MKRTIVLAALGLALQGYGARAADIDWKKVDAALGKTAAVSGEVHRYGLPRTDLNVTLEGVTIKPAFALGGWAAFAPMQRQLIRRQLACRFACGRHDGALSGFGRNVS